ncbi:MAG: lipid-A-disaccharide synthase [Rhodospirillales bacterium]|nr:lipid-A-disaccharide synthase [Alphaproteobacteria bacterium]MBL6947837.1 lipid-A-disaccharide synthase [Rhodospirillales bacterium]
MPPKLGILAGGGQLPELIVQVCLDSGREFFIIALEGQAAPGAFTGHPHARVRLGAAGEAIRHLKDAGCKDLVMAGSVVRPSISMLRPDAWTARFFATTGAKALGDDGLLTALISTLEEKEGFRIVGSDGLLPGLIATSGPYGRLKPGPEDEQDIHAGILAAQGIGRLDIGQAAVARDGRILATEDHKGTDALLLQVGSQSKKATGGVLVKVKKPGQESRVDLPAIGPDTVRAAAQAGLRGIAVEAGGALVLDRDGLAKAADEEGVFVAGVSVPAPGPLIFLSAGEPSGDLLGARLMQALKDKTEGRVVFAGVGGPHMEKQGLSSLFPMSDLTVMGALEVLPRLPRILGRISQTVASAVRLRPDAVVTIDSPDFNFRVAKRLKGQGIPLIHYVAPSVWAWRPGRAVKIAGFLDHLMTLLPFEPPYFEAEGLKATFTGHSVLDGGAERGDGADFRKRHGIAKGETVIAVLPGSRQGEVSRLGPVFGETLKLLKKKFPGLRIVVPTVDTVASTVRGMTDGWPGPVTVVEGEAEKFNAFDAADVALAASGTVGLELAMAKTPAIIAYKTNALTWFLVRALIKVRFAHLVNLILNREAIPEFLQGQCHPDVMAAALKGLLADPGMREKQRAAYEEALKQLRPEGLSPAERAAETVLALISNKGN